MLLNLSYLLPLLSTSQLYSVQCLIAADLVASCFDGSSYHNLKAMSLGSWFLYKVVGFNNFVVTLSLSP